VMNADLLQDLTSYKNSKDKGVMNASRSLISLFRDVAPEMLLKKDRGKTVSMAMSSGQPSQSLKFGIERGIATEIAGLELLEAYKKEQGELEEDNEDDWKAWEVGSEEDESDDSGGWIEVSSDEEHGIDISDSEDDEPPPPPPKVEGAASTLVTTRVLHCYFLANLRSLLLPIWPNWRNSEQKL
jgi:protein SDA1